MQPETDHLLIVDVAVAPTCQGRDVGTRLLVHAEDVAASLGLPELRLYTNGLFEKNLRPYARVGYRIDREEVLPTLGHAVYMGKPLR